MIAYFKRFFCALLVALAMTICFFVVEILFKKAGDLIRVIEWPVLSPWTCYALIMVLACAVVAFFKS